MPYSYDWIYIWANKDYYYMPKIMNHPAVPLLHQGCMLYTQNGGHQACGKHVQSLAWKRHICDVWLPIKMRTKFFWVQSTRCNASCSSYSAAKAPSKARTSQFFSWFFFSGYFFRTIAKDQQFQEYHDVIMTSSLMTSNCDVNIRYRQIVTSSPWNSLWIELFTNSVCTVVAVNNS